MRGRLFITVALFFVLLAAGHARDLQMADLGDFHLDNGEVIDDLRIGYRTI